MEATGQYRKLFKLYALPETGDDADAEMHSQKVDIREVSLHFSNDEEVGTRGRVEENAERVRGVQTVWDTDTPEKKHERIQLRA